MSLPEDLATPIRSRLKKEVGLPDSYIEEILQGLENHTLIDWTLLLNKEAKPLKTDEIDD